MIYKCDNCGFESKKYFGICPTCKDGVGEEVEEAFSSFAINSKGGAKIVPNIRKVEPLEVSAVASRESKFTNFNAVVSSCHGFIKGQVLLMGASPGVGKSTLCTAMSDEKTLYISSEENFSQVNQRVLRVNPTANCKILNSTSIDEILEAIRITECDFIIIDSLNSIEFGVGYQTTARFAHDITKMIKDSNKMGIIISQVGKTGEISGMNSIIHVVDTVLYLERSEMSANIILTSSKNRYGDIGGVAVFKHKENGFDEIDIDHMNIKNEIGATYTETRFGHKNMTIAIEALVAPAQLPFGLRSANGYNKNRLIQLIGVLSYFCKVDLNNKDVYVAISNGLMTDDISIELAMANSILSSLYGKSIIQKAYGEIRLNGKVVNGTLDGEEITHITDLIKKYK